MKKERELIKKGNLKKKKSVTNLGKKGGGGTNAG